MKSSDEVMELGRVPRSRDAVERTVRKLRS